MVGENFEISLSEMAKIALNHPPWLEEILRFAYLKWLKLHLLIHHGWRNHPKWLITQGKAIPEYDRTHMKTQSLMRKYDCPHKGNNSRI